MAGSSALGWTGATEENINEIASEAFLHGFVGNPNLTVFLSKEEKEVVGFCAVRKIDDSSVELAGIIVRQDMLGKGIGTMLFEAAKKEATTTGFAVMLVKTEANNERALSFYRSKGFVQQEQVLEEVSGTKVNLTILRLKI